MASSDNTENQRPDLDDSTNVHDVHASLEDSAAVDREKRVHENGMESVSLWLILISGIVVLVGGAVMGQGGGFFDYGELTKDGYMRGKSPLKIEEILPPQPAFALLKKEGKKVYSKCSGCHGPGGAGQPGEFPPLAGSEWVTGNTELLSQIIYHGLNGPITVSGNTYDKVMAPQSAGLGPKELAAVMTYIRNEWGNEASIVSPEMAANALKIAEERGEGMMNVEELKKNHDRMLSGAELAPDTLLDPITFEPVGDGEEGAAEEGQ